MKIRCLIVDDEPVGREIIEHFVQQTQQLTLVASCEDALDALNILQTEKVDLMFSDIQMPKINGLDLVKSLPNPPTIIFITAFDQFAVESYELNVADYLLKPVSYERFLKAVNKVTFLNSSPVESPALSAAIPSIFVKADNRMHKVTLPDIYYVESLKDYVKIYTKQGMLVAYSSLKSFEKRLPKTTFLRIHQSYIIALSAVKSLTGTMVDLINDVSLPVSKRHKDALYDALQITKGF